ncbi:MAG: hypothetical protein HFE84_10710 [Lachnospiraceae bacterium]|nr:hypothetical protein [Lachnospiraceae bacterium]
MLETLRKKAKKSHIIQAVIGLVLAIALLVITKFAIFSVITGAKKLDITADPATFEGKYVTIDADFILTDYIEHTTTTKRKYGGSSTRTDGNSYIAFQAIDDTEAESDTWYFYSIYKKKADASAMDALMDSAWDYLTGESSSFPDSLKVTGTWSKMEPQMERYYRETLAEMGIEESEYDIFYFYQIDTGKIGSFSVAIFWVMNAIALCLLLWGIINIIGIFGNGYAKKINKYLQNNPNVSISAIDADFQAAHVIDNDTWIGKNWTVYIRGTSADILTNKELIWGYYFRRTGKNSVSEMRLFTKGGGCSHISMSESDTKEALQYYAQEQPQMIVGYDKELEKMHKKDFSGFLNIKYNPAMSAAATDSFNRF